MNGDKRVQQENVWGKRTGDGKKAGENGLLWGRGGWMWWLFGACVSRVPRGLSLVIWGWGAEGGGQNLLLQKKTTGSETNPSPPLPPPLSHRDTKSLKSLLPEVLLTGASSPKSSWHNNPVGTRAVEMHWPASGSTTYVTRKTKKACSFPSWKYLIWLHVIQTQSSLKVTLDSASVRFFSSIYRLRFCPSLPSFPFSSIQRSH